ncbi:hypothetical protein ACMXYN_12765 [Neptuniibacter sp. PT8_73]|uniref:hypothetical protein n=1 Tax=unclassified Neptuniibacter TaxID=2630693 RepID=UPI0039F64D97
MFKRNLVSASIASILLSSSLSVTANTQNGEEEDSVNSWGVWAKQFATAAGGEFNTGALAFANLAQAETGRNGLNEPGFNQPTPTPTPTPDVAEGLCGAGAFCGFTTIYEGGLMYRMGPPQNEKVGTFDLQVSPDYFGERQDTTGSFSVSGLEGESYQATGLEGRAHEASGWLDNYDEFDDSDAYVHYYTDYGDGAVLINGFWTKGQWDDDDQYDGFDGAEGFFVGGVTTTIAQLNDFVSNLNGSVAEYSGRTFDGAEFDIAINFNSKKWSGNFGDSYRKQSDAFSVNGGKLSGVNFTAKSANLSSDAGRVTGQVAGAIFGKKATDVAGLVDIEISGDEGNVKRKTIFSTPVYKNNLP